MKFKEWHKTLFVLILFILGSSLNFYFGRYLIPSLFPDRPILPDLILDNIPYIEFGKYLMEAAPIILIAILIFLLFKTKFKDFNRYMLAFSLILILRAFTIILNPVGQSWTGFDDRMAELLANPTSDVNGYFFSGHTANMVMLSVIIGKIDRKWLVLCILLTLIGVGGMLLSRNHYTMDVYGGLVTALLLGYMLGILPYNKK